MGDERRIHQFDGKQLDVAWDGRLCIHAQECTRAKGELFVSGRQPWGEPDRGDPDYVAEVVRRCPSGALTYRRGDGGEPESAAPRNTVIVANNGPLYVQGQLRIDAAAPDMPGVAFRAALCRCGDSKNKPFCDNSHERAGFRDHGALGQTGEGFDAPGGPLEIKRAPDGPLLLSGSFTIVSGSGREAWHGRKAALCRCGNSRNKPFCDGSHKTAGFHAD
ncbi:MAG TPA: CDGSH iron-sulfur domain-containing protein [Candidatus Polarisedimenticolaceae bacterium]|nr:CDGSH iron-sulfur domain-containing protein [Candidatus Polarisedimenticolaceae bacterium]